MLFGYTMQLVYVMQNEQKRFKNILSVEAATGGIL